jgi:hypothetical protein
MDAIRHFCGHPGLLLFPYPCLRQMLVIPRQRNMNRTDWTASVSHLNLSSPHIHSAISSLSLSTMSTAKGVALVTGAAQGIGNAIALRLAADGYDIALNDLHAQETALRVTAEEVASRGRRVHCVLADVSSEIQVQTMVSDVVRELGGLDVVRATFPGTL